MNHSRVSKSSLIVVLEDVPATVSRPTMKSISEGLAKLNNDEALIVGQHAIDKVITRLIVFEEEVKSFS